MNCIASVFIVNCIYNEHLAYMGYKHLSGKNK